MRLQLIRGFLLGATLGFMIIAMAVACYPQMQPQQQTIDRYELAELEKVSGHVEDHERRLIRLEDALTAIRDANTEFTWWLRGIGGALTLAVLERILRTSGILRKTDGLGPVG